MLPAYISQTKPNPVSNRAPWYTNTAPTYAGVFLWIVFYQTMAQGTIDRASLGACIAALAAAGLICYALFYYVPGMLGMKTGYPLYVIGSSTFGTLGGYPLPGLFMGLLQVGWFAVGTFTSTRFILMGLGMDATPGSPTFWIVAALWTYLMGTIGILGIQYVARASLFLNAIPLLMILVVFFRVQGGLSQHPVPTQTDTWGAVATILQTVIGFFATAGAAGVDFGMNSRNGKDVRLGGLVGIAGAILIAGGLPLLSVAGARALNPAITSYSYDAVIGSMGGAMASSMFLLFALASIVPACFCAFIAGNSFATMLPGVSRSLSTLVGVTIALVLAGTGVAADLPGVFGLVGASFGPICGAMVADYLLSGGKWAGPREGINWAGYGAWAIGFVVGISPALGLKLGVEPLALASFVVGFVVYAALAKAGLEPKVVTEKLALAAGQS
ncbi:MAG: cytosine permease [Acidobacteria bacterium]|nr:cytosine permease [Acidobacteriota bacterium]